MAVYTSVSRSDLEAYMALYEFGKVKDFLGIVQGVENTNYQVTTERQKFILTLFESRILIQDIPFFFDVMSFFKDQGIPVAAPLRDRHGERLLSLCGKPAALFPFLSGTSILKPSIDTCAVVGALLAKLHRIGTECSLSRPNRLDRNAWQQLFLACGNRLNDIEDGLERDLDHEWEFLNRYLPSDLPKGVVHADLFPDNILLDEGNVSGILDFYFSCTEVFVYDLMLTFNAWTFDERGAPDSQRQAAFLESYQALRPLSVQEQRSLPLWGRAAALRILATRCYDSLHPKPYAVVTPKDPKTYLQILHFHQAS